MCAFLGMCGFHLHHCQSQPQSCFLTTCFFKGVMANFDIDVYIIAREKLFHQCKIDRLISYDVVRCPTRHRPIFTYTNADRRPYDM